MKISIVIPTFNRAVLLLETVESVLRQSLPPEEIIVVDDGSTDDTAEALRPYAAKGVRYIHQENAYLGAARNTGTRHLARDAEAALYLDSDDRLLPDALQRLTAALTANPNAALLYGRPRFIGPTGQPPVNQSHEWALEDFEGPGESVWLPLARRNFLCTAGCVLLPRATINRVGEWDASLPGTEDWDYWLRAAETGNDFVRIPAPQKPILEYRLHPAGMSQRRAAMLESEEKTLRRARERAERSGRAERIASLDGFLAERARRLQAAQNEGIALEAALLTHRHRSFRALLTRSGVSGWYRRLPLRWRLRMRDWFGIDRQA